MNLLLLSIASVTLALAAAVPAFGQDLGLFTGHDDIGAVKTAGTVEYAPDTQTYRISGSGTNMWAEQDEFHVVWRKMSGNFILTANAAFIGQGVDPHRKVGWIIRPDLETDSPYVDVALHGDGLMSLQFRRTKGAITEQIEAGISAPDVLQLERRDGTYIMRVAKFGDEFTVKQTSEISLPDEVYVGLFVCSHNPDVTEQAVFHNVRITVPAAADFRPYRDYIGSRLEIMEVATGRRRVLYTETGSFQAPNWTLDGKALIYSKGGLIYRYDIESGTPTVINTGQVNRNNNDHVISFDGTMLGISSNTPLVDNQSAVFTVPITGGEPTLITRRGPSYFHGWSPDGQWLTFTGGRNGNYDIYKIRADGTGDEVRLTTHDALDDGPEFTPDGRYIYFNSTRTGRMQLYRMRPDGGDQQRLTADGYNNWFPHIAPDGRTLVYIAYNEPVEPEDHPFYKHVYIRHMDVNGGPAKVIAYLYGGQGTINVPSWSPDGKYIAFVSNSNIVGVED